MHPRKKVLYLPKAADDAEPAESVSCTPEPLASVPPPVSEAPAGIYPCPCCGYLTLPVPRAEAIASICPVCFWENDVFDPGEDDPSDENRGLTLRQGRENYRRWGAVRPDLVVHARPPRPEERPKEMPASRLTAPPGTGTAPGRGKAPGPGPA